MKDQVLSLDKVAGSRVIGQEFDVIIGINKIGRKRYWKVIENRFFAIDDDIANIFEIDGNWQIIPVNQESESDLESEQNKFRRVNKRSIADDILDVLALKSPAESKEIVKKLIDNHSRSAIYDIFTNLLKMD